MLASAIFGFVGGFDLAPAIAEFCGDLPHPTSAERVEELAAGAARDATVVTGLAGGYVRAFALPCLDWPVQASEAPGVVRAPGAPPILVIGNTGDPVTAYEAARRVAGSLERGC